MCCAITEAAPKDWRRNMLRCSTCERYVASLARWQNLDLDIRVLPAEAVIGQYGALTWEKNTKNETDRRIVLDRDTGGSIRRVRHDRNQRCLLNYQELHRCSYRPAGGSSSKRNR